MGDLSYGNSSFDLPWSFFPKKLIPRPLTVPGQQAGVSFHFLPANFATALAAFAFRRTSFRRTSSRSARLATASGKCCSTIRLSALSSCMISALDGWTGIAPDPPGHVGVEGGPTNNIFDGLFNSGRPLPPGNHLGHDGRLDAKTESDGGLRHSTALEVKLNLESVMCHICPFFLAIQNHS